MQLHVLGTQFNVSAYPEDSQIKATLETGRIMINVRGDSVDYYLDPNNQLVYTPGQVRLKHILCSLLISQIGARESFVLMISPLQMR